MKNRHDTHVANILTFTNVIYYFNSGYCFIPLRLCKRYIYTEHISIHVRSKRSFDSFLGHPVRRNIGDESAAGRLTWRRACNLRAHARIARFSRCDKARAAHRAVLPCRMHALQAKEDTFAKSPATISNPLCGTQTRASTLMNRP